MAMPTREEFASAYLHLTGATRERADAIYDILNAPCDVDFLAALDDVCERATRTGEDQD